MGEKKKILVVDDMSQIRNILHFNLRKEGYDVVTAYNGEMGLKCALGDAPPDLIILDIMMPKMDGIEMIRELRNSDVGSNIPVIFLSAKAQKSDVLKGIEEGGNDYVVKPFKFPDLLEKIVSLLDMYDGNLRIETENEQYHEKDNPLVSGESATLFSGDTQERIDNRNRVTPIQELGTIMVTDMVSFGKEMETHKEDAFSKLLIYNEIVRKHISKGKGEEIKTIGDAFLIRFKSVVYAVEAGMNMQREFLEYNIGKRGVKEILVRIGIHIGDLLITDDDVFGEGVNVAAKIQNLAEPGGICISAGAYSAVKSSINIEVMSLGTKEIKGIKDSPEIFKVLI